MATLERIRRRSGLLLVIIGLAMLAFILTDLLSSGNSLFRGDANVVAKIDGEAIEITEFNKMIDKTTENYISQSQDRALANVSRTQLVNAAWDNLLRLRLMKAQYDKLGFEVTGKELLERVRNNPNIQNAPAFQDQVVGGFSEAMFSQYLNNIKDNRSNDAQAAQYWNDWVNFEDATRDQAISSKYELAVRKGLYVPSKFAEITYGRDNKNVTASIVGLEFSTVKDEEVEVSESDKKAYYAKNKENYKTEATRDILYVNFVIEPSEADKAQLSKEIEAFLEPQIVFNNATGQNDTLDSFSSTDNDSAFAAQRSELPIFDAFYKQGELPPSIDSIMFAQEVGYIHGPFSVGNYFQLSKLVEKTILPDSVRASHILVSFAGATRAGENVTRSPQEAQALADSIFEVVSATPSKFNELASSMNDDALASTKNGDLDWFNDKMMDKAFSDYCFQNSVGDMKVVFSQFGFHVIRIDGQKGSNKAVKVYNISLELVPSEETLDGIYDQASSFANNVGDLDNFVALADSLSYIARPVNGLTALSDDISGIGSNREVVRWAFNEETQMGGLQLFNNNNNSYIVATLAGAQEEGFTSMENLDATITLAVKNEKKAEILVKRINSKLNGDINALASDLGVAVTNSTINLAGSTLNSFGNEPKAIGAISALNANEISKPIVGTRGVYVALVTAVMPNPSLDNYSTQIIGMENKIRPRVTTNLFLSLKNDANIEDKRAKFF